MTTSEIHLFDFDGTLFKSPDAPADWVKQPGEWWWGIPQSLDEPCVPRKPDGAWWVGPVASKAKESIGNPDVYAVLATGRLDNTFRWRVPELLKAGGLNFDEVHLSTPGGTLQFKSRLLLNLLRKFPFVDTVRIWDDRREHLQAFKKLVGGLGYGCDVHHIQTAMKDCVRTPPASPRRVASRWLTGESLWYGVKDPPPRYQEAIERFGMKPVVALDKALRTWIHSSVWPHSEGGHPAIRALRRNRKVLEFLVPPPGPPSRLWRGLMYERPEAITERGLYDSPGPSSWTDYKGLAEVYCDEDGLVVTCKGSELASAGAPLLWPLPKWLARHLGADQDEWNEWVFDLKRPVRVLQWEPCD